MGKFKERWRGQRHAVETDLYDCPWRIRLDRFVNISLQSGCWRGFERTLTSLMALEIMPILSQTIRFLLSASGEQENTRPCDAVD